MPDTTRFVRAGLPEPTGRIAQLPVDDRGWPVPFFVAWIDGKPDHRVMDPRKVTLAIRNGVCWVCGGQLTPDDATFAIGPMCVVNRISAEPASHHACALYSTQACPFLSRPHAVRREANMPVAHDPPGTMLTRNPGITALYRSAGPSLIPVDGGVLFDIGEPAGPVEWRHQGREATREEVLAAFESGLPTLIKQCKRKQDHLDELAAATDIALALVPA